jgi:hypothetical protein
VNTADVAQLDLDEAAMREPVERLFVSEAI